MSLPVLRVLPLAVSLAVLLLACAGGASAQTPVASGGTGAATAQAALANLGAQPLAPGDLRRYGWHGDGRTDDTPAFNAALAAVPAAGGEVVVPFSEQGTLLAVPAAGGPAAVVIDKPVAVRGEGGGPHGQVTILPGGPTDTVFSVTAPFVTLSDLAFGPAPGAARQTGGSYVVVGGANAARFRADRLTLSDFHEGITVASDVASVEITGLRGLIYHDGDVPATALLHFRGGTDVRVSGVTADGGGAGRATAGIWVENLGGDATISGADIIRMGTDLLVNPGPGQIVTSLWVTDSFLDTATRGALWTTRGGGRIVRARLSNVWASSHTHEGIRVEAGVDGLDIDGPHVLLNGGDGIALAGGTNVRVRGGQIAQNGGDGVHVAAGVSYWSVVDATVGATAGLGGNAGYAVRVDAGGSDYFQVQDNNVAGNGPATAANGSVADNSSGIHKSVVGNIGDPQGYSAYRDGPTGFLTFRGNQANFTGYRFVGPDGTAYATAGAGGLTLGGPLAFAPGGSAAAASRANLGVPQYANVRDYGAADDCRTDSTAALNAALASGLPAYLPGSADAGACYLVSGPLNAAGPAVSVFGDGEGSRITTNAAGGDLVVLGGPGGRALSAVSMHDLVLGTAAGHGTAVRATGPVARASFRNLRIVGSGARRFDTGLAFTEAAAGTPGGTFGSLDIGAEIDVRDAAVLAANGRELHLGHGSRLANCARGLALGGNVGRTVLDGGATISGCRLGIVAGDAGPGPNGTLSADPSVSVGAAAEAGVRIQRSALARLNWGGAISGATFCIQEVPGPAGAGAAAGGEPFYSVAGARLISCSAAGIAVGHGFLSVSGTEFVGNGTAIDFASAAGAAIIGNRFAGSGRDFASSPQSGNYVVTNNVLSGAVQNNGRNGIVQFNILPR